MSEANGTPTQKPRLKERFDSEIAPALMTEFGYTNTMQVPRVDKISVNIGMGEAITDGKTIERASQDLTIITGQKPIVTRARKSIATFKLRAGMPIGVKVTLRGRRMWDFLDRLISIALPAQRDFRGISPDSFDGRGNYSLGLREQLVFPEIDYDEIDKVRGMEVTIVTTAGTDEEGRRLLAMMDMPFDKGRDCQDSGGGRLYQRLFGDWRQGPTELDRWDEVLRQGATGHFRDRAGEPARAADVHGLSNHTARPERAGDQHSFYAQRCHEWKASPARTGWRRGTVQRLVMLGG